MVPSGNMAGGVFNPTARPFALDGAMFVDNGLPGRLAFALLSLLVVASALNALMKLFHGIVVRDGKTCERTPGGKGAGQLRCWARSDVVRVAEKNLDRDRIAKQRLVNPDGPDNHRLNGRGVWIMMIEQSNVG